jgi:hypothetical protein
MTRKDALRAMEGAGAHNDTARFTRLFIEHRISKTAADEAWRKGVALRRFCEARDAQKEQTA